MLRSNSRPKNSGKGEKKERLRWGGFAEKEGFNSRVKE